MIIRKNGYQRKAILSGSEYSKDGDEEIVKIIDNENNIIIIGYKSNISSNNTFLMILNYDYELDYNFGYIFDNLPVVDTQKEISIIKTNNGSLIYYNTINNSSYIIKLNHLGQLYEDCNPQNFTPNITNITSSIITYFASYWPGTSNFTYDIADNSIDFYPPENVFFTNFKCFRNISFKLNNQTLIPSSTSISTSSSSSNTKIVTSFSTINSISSTFLENPIDTSSIYTSNIVLTRSEQNTDSNSSPIKTISTTNENGGKNIINNNLPGLNEDLMYLFMGLGIGIVLLMCCGLILYYIYKKYPSNSLILKLKPKYNSSTYLDSTENFVEVSDIRRKSYYDYDDDDNKAMSPRQSVNDDKRRYSEGPKNQSINSILSTNSLDGNITRNSSIELNKQIIYDKEEIVSDDENDEQIISYVNNNITLGQNMPQNLNDDIEVESSYDDTTTKDGENILITKTVILSGPSQIDNEPEENDNNNKNDDELLNEIQTITDEIQ